MAFADLPNVRTQSTGESIEDYARHLANLLAMYRDTLDYVINGHINFKNIQALGITTKNLKAGSVVADKIQVDELSAITADLGHITAGLIEAITIISSTITGSLIQTDTAGNYPRAFLSSTGNNFGVEGSAVERLEVKPGGSNRPILSFSSASTTAQLALIVGVLQILSNNHMDIFSEGNTSILSLGDIDLIVPNGNVNIDNLIVDNGTQFNTITRSGTASATLPQLEAQVNGIIQDLRSMKIYDT